MAMAKRPTMRPERITGEQLREGFLTAARRMAPSRERIVYARQVEDGLLALESGREYDTNKFERDPLLPRLPQRSTIVSAAHNRFSAERPYSHRRAHGGSLAAGRAADEAERWVNAATDLTFDYEEAVGLALEGEFGLVVVPTPADWRRVPDLTDLYGVGRRPGQKRARAYRKARDGYLASRPPWTCRLISATDCAPVLTRGRGPRRYGLHGLYVRTLFDRDELIRDGWDWRDKENGALVPRGWEPANTYGACGQVYLYEYFGWLDDDDGEPQPIVAYCVGGQDTYHRRYSERRDDRAVVINLREEYGLNELPAAYFFGLHKTRDEPGERGMPYLYALCDLILASEGQLGANITASWENSFTGHVAQYPPDAPPESYLEADGGLRRFKKPAFDEIVTLPGAVVPFAQAQIGRDAWQVLSTVLGLLDQNAPSENLSGGGSIPSGHAGAVLDELNKVASRQVPEAARQALEFAAERIVELCCTLARGEWETIGGAKVSVPLYVNVEGDPNEAGEPEEVEQVVEFRESWFGRVYDLRATYPNRGTLAEIQQTLGLWKEGAATLDDVLEKRGKTSTTLEKAKILGEKLLRETPEGQQELLLDVYRYRGDKERAEKLELEIAGRLSPGGMPTAALEAPPDSGPAAGGTVPTDSGAPPGTGLPNLGNSVLGGIVGGEMGTGRLLADERARLAIQAPSGQE